MAKRDDGRTVACSNHEVVEAVARRSGFLCSCFLPRRELLAVGGSRDNLVSLWKLPEGRRVAQLKPPIPKPQFPEYVRSLAFSPDGKLLAVGTRNGLVHLYRLPQGKLLGSLGPFLSSGYPLTVVSLAFSPDGKKLAVLLEQGDVFQLWQVSDRRLIWERKHDKVSCFQVVFAKGGKEVVGAGYDLLRCDAADGKVIADKPLFQSLPGGISSDGQWIAAWNYKGEVKIYRSSDFKEFWRSSVPGWKLKRTLKSWAQRIEKRWGIKAARWIDFDFPLAFGFTFSPDKRWLALGFNDGSIRLWKIR